MRGLVLAQTSAAIGLTTVRHQRISGWAGGEKIATVSWRTIQTGLQAGRSTGRKRVTLPELSVGLSLISEEYRQMNEQLHKVSTYGASGHRWVPEILEWLGGRRHVTILDYGCGKGTFKTAFYKSRHYSWYVSEYDPAVPGKDNLPSQSDFVVCTDVLEHIEPEHLDEVLQHIQTLTRKEAFLVAATRPAKKTLPDGRNAHLIIETPEWWLERIMKYFTIKKTHLDVKQEGEVLFIVEPRA